MEVGAEAKRIMVVALGKLYSSRTQRGGLRLHRSLLLTLVMKSARDMYHAAAQLEEEEECARELTAPTTCEQTHGLDLDLPTDSETTQPEPCCHPPAEEAPADSVVEAEEEPGRTAEGHTFTHGPSRKRRGKIAAVPDFLPLKKAKLDCPQTQLVVLVDYVTCGDLGTTGINAPSPIPVPMAIAAC